MNLTETRKIIELQEHRLHQNMQLYQESKDLIFLEHIRDNIKQLKELHNKDKLEKLNINKLITLFQLQKININEYIETGEIEYVEYITNCKIEISKLESIIREYYD